MNPTIDHRGVLNPWLFEQLRAHFGEVQVANHRQETVGSTLMDPITQKPRVSWAVAGEYYRVCCPYCSDSRYRLYIHHRWGEVDRFGRSQTFLACCFNETRCLDDVENREDLAAKLHSHSEHVRTPIILPGIRIDPSKLKAELPGELTPLEDLPSSHPAISYLMARSMDPTILGKFYGVGYCDYSPKYRLACNRIVIPITRQGKLIAWQARYLGEMDWKRSGIPKYFTMPGAHPSLCLGNIDQARRFRTGVLVEGWFDVFGFGPMACCCFTNRISESQKSILCDAFRDYGLVILLDPQEFNEGRVEKIKGSLTVALGGKGRVAAVKLPDGTDPGSLDRSFLRDYVAQHALDQGLKVDWRRRSVK